MINLKAKRTRVVLLGLTAAGIFLAAAVMSLTIKQVTVSGNNRYTKEEVIDMIFKTGADRNTLYCYGKDKFGEHQQIPFVEDYQLVFHGPFEVEVIVHEKSVVGYVAYMSSYMYFDKDSIIVESTNEEVEGIPCIEGLEYGQIVLHKPLPVEDQAIFGQILILTQVLSTYDLGVKKIQYDRKGDAKLYTEDLEVVLGDGSNIDGKILRLSNMMPELEGLKGTLYLDTYDPLNNQMAYTFKKNS